MQEINLTKEELLKACGWFSGYTLVIFLTGLLIGSLLVGLSQKGNASTNGAQTLTSISAEEQSVEEPQAFQFAKIESRSENASSIAKPNSEAEENIHFNEQRTVNVEEETAIEKLSNSDEPVRQSESQIASITMDSTQEKSTATETYTAPAELTESLIEPGYTLQVGLFAKVENAQALYDTLVGQGFEAKMALNQTAGKILFQVSVGSFISRDEAVAMREILLETAKLKSVYIKEFIRPLSKVALN